MRILIIGGTGQISTPITRWLVERGDQITLYNRGISQMPVPAGVRRIYGDRRKIATFKAQMDEAGNFDCVIDMVGYVPEEAESVVQAFRGRVGQFIFCSTAAVYQRPADRYPITEDEPRQPTSVYGRNKARCEEILLAAHRRRDLPVTILRPANTYGPGGDLVYTLGWGNRFLDRIRKNRPLVVPGDGSTLRVYCHVEDVAAAFVAAIGNARALGQAYHLTGEEWLTWERYFQFIAQAMGTSLPRLVHIPSDVLFQITPEYARDCIENYRFNNIFDNTQAKSDLNFRYTIPFIQGVADTIRWLEDNDKIEDSDRVPVDDQIIFAWDEALGAMSLATGRGKEGGITQEDPDALRNSPADDKT